MPDVYGDIECHSVYTIIDRISWIYDRTSCSYFLPQGKKISCGGTFSHLFYHRHFLCDQSVSLILTAPHLLSDHTLPVYICPGNFIDCKDLSYPGSFVSEESAGRVPPLYFAGIGI